ncbi:Retrovirus-related Pol polyprotein from transposon [Sesamum angolense]|uniref:Retrovirus-related Pol polyprotein from transposon n=1 Tax=Sesamum angolense TaxID=2727404 RepID=A0AAE1VXM2_9LAMI|nr:Retrovirus-related Pol polyprotein from transposon [Sesamum angolense]
MMDASQGYHQIMLAPEDHKRVNFITSDGTFCYVAMPFGLKNAGVTYQRLVDKIFQPQLCRNMEVYMDGMLVKSKKARNHVEYLEKTFAVLRKYRLKLNPRKCAFGINRGRFLGFMVTQRGRQLCVGTRRRWYSDTHYYVSKVLNMAEYRYPFIEKMVLALVISARKLRLYFLSYPVGFRINTPLKQVLGKPKASGRLVKWAIELSEFYLKRPSRPRPWPTSYLK